MMSLRLDPRTKLFLILLCVFCAMFAPNLYFQLALVGVIGVLAVLSGKWRYAMRGFVVYALICVFRRDERHMADDVRGISGLGT